jgi:hypothetical protein
MREGQSLKFAGDVSIDKVKIITSDGFYQDSAAQVINIQYYEDLFSPFISGSLIIKDSLDLVNLFPFVGEEFVELEITTPALQNGAIKGRYYIYKLSDRELIGDNVVVYQLHFISVEAVIDLNKKVSKVYTGNVANTIKSIVADKTDGLQSDKKVYAEETTRDAKFISNFWSPVKCINHLTELAVNRNSSPSYVFFENRDGFYFVSLDSLYASDVYQDFTFDKYTRDDLGNGKTVRNPQEDFKRITSVSIPVGFDYMDRIRSGAFASKSISYDLTNKKYNVRNYNMFEKFNKQNHLNKYAIASDRAIFRSNSLLVNYPRALNTFSGFGDTTNYKTFQERISLLKQAESNKIEIVVPGRTDYTVGQKVSVTLNKVEPVSKDDIDTTDKMFSGFYLVSAINHYITRESHECNMELIKDSLQLNLDGKK